MLNAMWKQLGYSSYREWLAFCKRMRLKANEDRSFYEFAEFVDNLHRVCNRCREQSKSSQRRFVSGQSDKVR